MGWTAEMAQCRLWQLTRNVRFGDGATGRSMTGMGR